jgi:hypothetical protein
MIQAIPDAHARSSTSDPARTVSSTWLDTANAAAPVASIGMSSTAPAVIQRAVKPLRRSTAVTVATKPASSSSFRLSRRSIACTSPRVSSAVIASTLRTATAAMAACANDATAAPSPAAMAHLLSRMDAVTRGSPIAMAAKATPATP